MTAETERNDDVYEPLTRRAWTCNNCLAVAVLVQQSAEIARLRAALEVLLPDLVLDLRYVSEDEDDDKDALRSRVETVTEALSALPGEK